MHTDTVPHLAVPFRITGTRAATVEDGTLDEVAQNVRVILGTRTGERLAVPAFGTADPTFGLAGATPDAAEVEGAVTEWEPRATISLEYRAPTVDGTADVVVRVGMEEG